MFTKEEAMKRLLEVQREIGWTLVIRSSTSQEGDAVIVEPRIDIRPIPDWKSPEIEQVSRPQANGVKPDATVENIES